MFIKDKDFTNLKLRGIDLKNRDLTNTDFEGTDLSDANLRGSNLENTKLVGTKLDSADLSNTKLTGICIQNWQVTDSTKFEEAKCEYIYLTPENQNDDVRRKLKSGEQKYIDKFFKEFLISPETQNKINELKEQFDMIDLIGDKVIREYQLIQAVNKAKDTHGIEADRFRQMFEDYLKQKLQAKRQSSWWQNFLWFKVEPSIERLNHLTKEMDIFPLLEQMGRLSILIAVIAYVNNALQPQKLNVEEQYRSWEILRSDNDKVKGIRRLALEQLRDKGTTLKKIQVPPSIDLSGINLSNTDLTGAILKNVNLKDANLSKAKLEDTDLTGVNLSGASLGYQNSSSSDQNCSLTNQGGKELFDFDKIKECIVAWPTSPEVWKQGSNLTKADLQGANLTKANLTKADLTGANLTKADLTGANLTKADLTGANLTKANLTTADLTGANLTTADLTTADLTTADLTTADLTGANLTGANLTGANLTGADLTGADLTGADLTGADLTTANLTTANLTTANLNGAKNLKDVTSWQLTNLSQANFSSFDEKKLKGSKFEGAFYINGQPPSLPGTLKPEELEIQSIENIKDLQGVNLSGADLRDTNLSKANLSDADLRDTNLSKANLSGADLRKTDLAGAILKGAKYSKATKFPKGFKPQAEGMVEIK